MKAFNASWSNAARGCEVVRSDFRCRPLVSCRRVGAGQVGVSLPLSIKVETVASLHVTQLVVQRVPKAIYALIAHGHRNDW